MTDDGVSRALAVFTSAYSSYSGCRQYRENLEAARAAKCFDAIEARLSTPIENRDNLLTSGFANIA